MFRILSEFRQELVLDKSWETYRTPLKRKIEEVARRLQARMEKVREYIFLL